MLRLLIEKKQPTKKSLGVFKVLEKSLNERPRPNPSIIKTKQIGAIFVTISIIYYPLDYNVISLKNILISSIKRLGFSNAGK